MTMFVSAKDGSPAKATAELMSEIKKSLEGLKSKVNLESHDSVRFAQWPGQAEDGRKHTTDDMDEPVFPFEGATDSRSFMCDNVVNELTMLCVMSGMRARFAIGGTEKNLPRAAKLEALALWIRDTLLGWKYMRDQMELCNYLFSQSPAIGLLKVIWRRTYTLRMETMTLDKILALYQRGFLEEYQAVNPEMTEQEAVSIANVTGDTFRQALADGESDDALAAKLIEMVPFLKTARARRVISDIRKYGEARFPVPTLEYDGPEMTACRYGDGFICDPNARDFQKLDIWFEQEWLSETDCRSLALEEGWSETFSEELFGKEGDETSGKKGVWAFEIAGRRQNVPDYQKSQYQIVRAYIQRTNEDGVKGRYWLTFRPDIEEPATDLNLIDLPHRLWPGHLFQREVLDGSVGLSRSVPEISGPSQSLIKLFTDSLGDNGQLKSVPPIITMNRRDQGQLYIEPLMEIPLRPGGKVDFMNGPDMPQMIMSLMTEVQRLNDEYWGRTNKGVPPDLVNLKRQFLVLWYLCNLREVWRQVIMLSQAYAGDDLLAQVTGRDGARIIRSATEIEGPFTLTMALDPIEFSLEELEKKGRILRDILMPLNKQGVVDFNNILIGLVYALFPALSSSSVKLQDQALEDELADEAKIYINMRAGLEDPRPTDGSINYAARLGFYERLLAAPGTFSDIGEDKQTRIQDRVKFLEAQAQQFGENAEIGREGAERSAPESVEVEQ
jgi:hypothetical protein